MSVYDSCDEDGFIVPRKKRLDQELRRWMIKDRKKTIIETIEGKALIEVKIEEREKNVCIAIDYDDESGVPYIWLQESTACGDFGVLSGSHKKRTDYIKSLSPTDHQNAIFANYVEEFKEEIDCTLGPTLEDSIDYIKRNATFIASDPWIERGKISRNKRWYRQYKYVPVTIVLDMSEYLLINYRGGTSRERRAEFMATRNIHHYLYAGDGEVSSVVGFPVDRLPTNIWNKHRNILEKMIMDGHLPTFRQVVGVPKFIHYPKTDPNDLYGPKMFQKHLHLLQSNQGAHFFRKHYPTLVGDSDSPEGILGYICNRHQCAICKREREHHT